MMSSNSKVGYIEDRDLNVKMVAIPYKVTITIVVLLMAH